MEPNILEAATKLVQLDLSLETAKNIIVIGERKSGKTSIFNILRSQATDHGSYSQTVGINYSYEKFAVGSKVKLRNFYEIGGGKDNLTILRSIINSDNLENSLFFVVVDGIQPNNLFGRLTDLLNVLENEIKKATDTVKFASARENIKEAHGAHKNIGQLVGFPARIAIVLNKYDVFEKYEMFTFN